MTDKPDIHKTSASDSNDSGFLRFPVHGKCPSCGESSLVLNSSSRVQCKRTECDRPDAVSEILDNAKPVHSVRLSKLGYNAEHPLIERLEGELFDCSFDKYMRSLTEPPMPPGDYIVQHVQTSKTTGYWDWQKTRDNV